MLRCLDIARSIRCMKTTPAAKTSTFIVRFQGPSGEGHRAFSGFDARNRAGAFAREMAMSLAGEPCLLTIADPAKWDRHADSPLVLSAYLYVPGSQEGWVHQRGYTIRGIEAPMACAAE